MRVDDLNVRSVNIENMIEILKAKKYNEILNFIGKHEILKVEDFYNKFSIEEKYRVLNEKSVDSKSKEIEIRRTEDYYINERGDKDYIFEIIVENVKGYYFPN